QYGFINACLKSLVVEKFGEEAWVKLSQTCFYLFIYLLSGVKPEVVLRQFGEHFFEFCKRSGYHHMLRTLGGNLSEFTENLDALHSYLSLSYKEMNAPSFRVERNPDGTMLLHYYSDRRGLCHITGITAQEVLFSFACINKYLQYLFCYTGKSLKTFEPVYPMKLKIDLQTFCHAFPFHIVFDEQLVVHQAGVNLQRTVPGLQIMNIHLDEYFSIVHPEVTFTISSIRKFINSHFVKRKKYFLFLMCVFFSIFCYLSSGQMIWMPSLRCMLYQASPLLRSLQELEEMHMHISDIAPHDVTRDLILLNHQRLAEMELSSQLERKKEELRILSQHLEEEKRKTENLLYAMLPKHVANQLKEVCLVTFTNICAMCEPIQIVHMLNSMYLQFDRLTTVHNVYKVETIGDAYMVVGGVPIPVSSHAERVANFALGMIIAAKEVINPITGGPIQIRVGLHSGPVLAGVVGEKMPRYCLFGDTVNTASRMESHGLPNKIHLSPTVYQALKNKCFVIQKRGEIEVKGKGSMTTYFLERNTGVSEQQIMGLCDLEATDGEESSQGSYQPGFYRRNVVICCVSLKL
uniref:guanylate cyclase n=1 Tax=Oreochromis aureus TaxID=47969 RepID=A0A668U4H1_OREAU